MFKKIDKHMKGDHRSVAEEFELTHEAKFDAPTLEQIYWKNPNAQRGEIKECFSYGPIEGLMTHSEGV